MFEKFFQKRTKNTIAKINYGRPADPDTDGMDTFVTQKNLFPYCAEEMVRYSDAPGLCDCCSRRVDKYIISEPSWDGWERYRMQSASDDKSAATDSSKNFELHLCTECIASGKAAQKFSIKYFNIPVHVSDEWEIKGYKEARYCTPEHVSCVERDSEIIPCHCSEACELVAKFEGGSGVPEEMKGSILPFSGNVLKTYEQEDFVMMHEQAKLTFVFKCRQCGQYLGLFY